MSMRAPFEVHERTRRATHPERGFTLVELMVALTGGLFLSIVVFALARDASRFYQHEGRLASATLAGMVGFERLKADIERAGYLSTPNIQADPNLAVAVDSGTPPGLFALASLRITPNTPNLSGNAAYALNLAAGQTITPAQIVLSGSYTATDEFPIADASTGQTIYLQVNTPAMARLGYLNAGSSNAQLALLQNVFGATPGLILRVKDQAGKLYFGTITAVNAGTQPSVTIANPFPLRSSGAGVSGLRGFEVGSSANVVNIVRYRVLDLQHDPGIGQWGALFTASSGAPGEDTRTELVRDELNAAGTPIAGSADVVAEYAVDLQFSVFGQATPGTPGLVFGQPVPSDPYFGTFFNGTSGGSPQRVRSVRVRLSVRSREADRTTGLDGGLYRFQIGPSLWARVRTFQADVALPNQASVQW
jgi:hypothetical protein